MTPADLLAALDTITVAMRRYRYPDDLATEDEDWATFVDAVHAAADGVPHAELERLFKFYGSTGAPDVYFAWRAARIRERKPVKRRRR